MISISNGSLRLQLLTVLLVILVIPVLVMLYDLLYASKSDEVMLENKQERLTEIVMEISSKLEDAAGSGVNKDLASVFIEAVKPMVSDNEGVRLGLYLVNSDKMYIEGFLHEFRELSPVEQREREQRILREVSVGIKAALATEDLIVRVGRTWDDEFLECLRPVLVNGEPVGVVWAEERMHPIFAKSYHFRRLTSFVALIGFCVGVTGLLVVILNLTRNIATIKTGLETLENDINFRMAPMPGEMGQITKAINKMAVGLAEREQLKEQLRRADFLAALGRLVTGIAHELRNPLGVLRATVEVMEDDLQECPGIKNYSERIKKQIDRQSKTVNELLDFGRPDDGILETLNVNELVSNVLDFSQPLLYKSNISLDTCLKDDLPAVVGSSEKLQQVFLNLIVNAVQAMPQGGILTITSRTAGEWVLVSIKDTGKGISGDDLSHIFEPFYTTKDGGSGLGLAISQQIIRVHGGRIEAHSRSGEGTEMTVYLPLQKGDEKSDNTNDPDY